MSEPLPILGLWVPDGRVVVEAVRKMMVGAVDGQGSTAVLVRLVTCEAPRWLGTPWNSRSIGYPSVGTRDEIRTFSIQP